MKNKDISYLSDAYKLIKSADRLMVTGHKLFWSETSNCIESSIFSKMIHCLVRHHTKQIHN